MQRILSDHNCERHAQQIFYALQRFGYDHLIPMTLNIFPDENFPYNAGDEIVWRLCQENDYLLLTGNHYCERCAIRLAEIVLDLDTLRGVTRLYLP